MARPPLTHAQKLGKAPQSPVLREPPRALEPELESLPEVEPGSEPPLEPVILRPGAIRTTVAYALSYLPARGSMPAGYAMETFEVDFDATGTPSIARHDCSNPTDRRNAGDLFSMTCGYRVIHCSRDLHVDRLMNDQLPGRRTEGHECSDEACAIAYFDRKAGHERRAEYVLAATTPKEEREQIVLGLKARGWHAWIERDLLIATAPRKVVAG